MNFPGGSLTNAGDTGDAGSIPGSGRSPREGNGNPLQCSCLENPRDRGASWAAVYGVAQSRTRLKRLSSSSSRYTKGFLGGSDGKASACNAGDPVRSLGQEDPLEEASGNPLQYSCLENPMDGGAWWATVHGFAESQTRLSDSTLTLTFEVIQGVPSTISNTQYGGKYECE